MFFKSLTILILCVSFSSVHALKPNGATSPAEGNLPSPSKVPRGAPEGGRHRHITDLFRQVPTVSEEDRELAGPSNVTQKSKSKEQRSNDKNPFVNFPDEILVLILEFNGIDLKSLLAVQNTCQKLRRIASDKILLAKKIDQEPFGPADLDKQVEIIMSTMPNGVQADMPSHLRNVLACWEGVIATTLKRAVQRLAATEGLFSFLPILTSIIQSPICQNTAVQLTYQPAINNKIPPLLIELWSFIDGRSDPERFKSFLVFLHDFPHLDRVIPESCYAAAVGYNRTVLTGNRPACPFIYSFTVMKALGAWVNILSHRGINLTLGDPAGADISALQSQMKEVTGELRAEACERWLARESVFSIPPVELEHRILSLQHLIRELHEAFNADEGGSPSDPIVLSQVLNTNLSHPLLFCHELIESYTALEMNTIRLLLSLNREKIAEILRIADNTARDVLLDEILFHFNASHLSDFLSRLIPEIREQNSRRLSVTAPRNDDPLLSIHLRKCYADDAQVVITVAAVCNLSTEQEQCFIQAPHFFRMLQTNDIREHIHFLFHVSGSRHFSTDSFCADHPLSSDEIARLERALLQIWEIMTGEQEYNWIGVTYDELRLTISTVFGIMDNEFIWNNLVAQFRAYYEQLEEDVKEDMLTAKHDGDIYFIFERFNGWFREFFQPQMQE